MQKNLYLSVAVTIVVLVIDTILFHDHEGLMTVLGIAAFFGGLGLFVILDQREYGAHYSQWRRSNPRPDR
jgi:hypothetical protein